MKPKKFVVPQEFLERLNEFSNGGFVLFLFDENGNPAIWQKSDDYSKQTAMESYVFAWANAMQIIKNNQFLQNIIGSHNDDGDEGPSSANGGKRKKK